MRPTLLALSLGILFTAWAAEAAEHLRGAPPPSTLDGVELHPSNSLSHDGYTTLRFKQKHHGLTVANASAALRIGPGGAVLLTMIDTARELDVDTTPTLTSSEARAIAEAWRGVPLPPGTRWELVVLGGGRRGRLAWNLDAPGLDGGWRFRVDAHTGQLLQARSLAVGVTGRVYPLHPLATPDPEDRDLVELTPDSPQRLTGWDDGLVVTRFVYGGGSAPDALAQSATPNAGSDFLYDPPEDVTDPADPFAEVNAYYHLSRARQLFTELGVDMSGPQWTLVAAVNVLDTGAPFDGAFFSPAGLGPPWNAASFVAFGQGHAADFAYDADAFFHELTHYVSYNAVGFNAGQFAFDEQGLSPFSIAVDEGVADYFACSANGDPVLGEASLSTIGKTRDLSDTSMRCPDDVGGEGHRDGIIVGSLGWSLRERFGPEMADSMMWTATTLLPYQATFGDFARGVIQRAEELASTGALTPGDLDEVHDIVRSRGLDDCDRSIRLPVGSSRKTLVFGLDSIAEMLETTCEELLDVGEPVPSLFQFHAAGKEAPTGLRIDVELTPLAQGELDWAIYARANHPVGFEVGDPVPVPVVSTFDHAVEGITGRSGSLVVDGDSNPPFDPEADYHVVITHRNCPGVEAVVTASGVAPEEPPADAGLEAGAEAGSGVRPASNESHGGCGCRASKGAGGWAPALLLILAAWLLRRIRENERRTTWHSVRS